jgi:uncharacterized membrane protein HdeD (DUF308 family)
MVGVAILIFRRRFAESTIRSQERILGAKFVGRSIGPTQWSLVIVGVLFILLGLLDLMQPVR